MTHMHWIWWFYRSRKDNGDYEDVTTVDVMSESYDEAYLRVSSLLSVSLKGGNERYDPNGPGYLLREVIEHLPGACSHDSH